MKNSIKFSSKIDQKVFADLRQLAKETRQPISELLTDAVSEYLQRARIRPMFQKSAEKVIAEDRALLKKLAQ